MSYRIRYMGILIAITFLLVLPCVGEDVSKIPMQHFHGDQFPGKGILEFTDHGIAWTEQQGTDYGPGGPFSMNKQAWHSVSKHSFSVGCTEIQDSALNFPRIGIGGAGLNWIALRIASKEYKFESTEGYSSAVVLDQIRAVCHLGEPVLESSKNKWTNNNGLAGPNSASLPREEVSFDSFFEDNGGRGVLFVSRTGLVFEQVTHQPPVMKKGGKMGWKGVEKVEVARMSPLSLPCSSLTDITLRGSNMDSHFGNGHTPEIDINTGAVKYQFFLGANIHPQAVKQAIADYCSRN